MIKLQIHPEQIKIARTKTEEFDKQKTFDKFECDHNYIGLLGEMVFHAYLQDQDIVHEWKEFVKQGWEEPDFIINGESVDLKTTHSPQMWIQKISFDVYILARINEETPFTLILVSFIKKKDLEVLSKKGRLETIDRGFRKDLVVKVGQMTPFEELLKEWTDKEVEYYE